MMREKKKKKSQEEDIAVQRRRRYELVECNHATKQSLWGQNPLERTEEQGGVRARAQDALQST